MSRWRASRDLLWSAALAFLAIGTALIAAHAARDGAPERIYPLVVCCGLFGISQSPVVVALLDRPQTGHLPIYPYLIRLGALIGAWLPGAGSSPFDRTELGPGGRWVPTWAKALGALRA